MSETPNLSLLNSQPKIVSLNPNCLTSEALKEAQIQNPLVLLLQLRQLCCACDLLPEAAIWQHFRFEVGGFGFLGNKGEAGSGEETCKKGFSGKSRGLEDQKPKSLNLRRDILNLHRCCEACILAASGSYRGKSWVLKLI